MDDAVETGSNGTRVITPDNPPVPNQPVYGGMKENTAEPTFTRRELLARGAKMGLPVLAVGALATVGTEKKKPGTIKRWLNKLPFLTSRDEASTQIQQAAPIPKPAEAPPPGLGVRTSVNLGFATQSQSAPLRSEAADTVGKYQQELGAVNKTKDAQNLDTINNAPLPTPNYNDGNPAPTPAPEISSK